MDLEVINDQLANVDLQEKNREKYLSEENQKSQVQFKNKLNLEIPSDDAQLNPGQNLSQTIRKTNSSTFKENYKDKPFQIKQVFSDQNIQSDIISGTNQTYIEHSFSRQLNKRQVYSRDSSKKNNQKEINRQNIEKLYNFETLREHGDQLQKDSEGLGQDTSLNYYKLQPVVISGGMNLIIPQTRNESRMYAKDSFGNEFQESFLQYQPDSNNFMKLHHPTQQQKNNLLDIRNLLDNQKIQEIISKKNPNFKIDLNNNYNSMMNDLIQNKKDLINKEGNIKINGILIKKALSLGTKFNPNFKDPIHAPQGQKPQSRGLTQGNILQLATQAFVNIQQKPLTQQIRYRTVQRVTDRHNLSTEINEDHNISQRNKFNIEIKSRQLPANLIMQGVKKQTVDKFKSNKKINLNKDMATSIKSFGNTKFDKDKIVEIKNGLSDGMSKVQVNVKINQKNIAIKSENQSQLAKSPLERVDSSYKQHNQESTAEITYFNKKQRNIDVDQTLNSQDRLITNQATSSIQNPDKETQYFQGQSQCSPGHETNPSKNNAARSLSQKSNQIYTSPLLKKESISKYEQENINNLRQKMQNYYNMNLNENQTVLSLNKEENISQNQSNKSKQNLRINLNQLKEIENIQDYNQNEIDIANQIDQMKILQHIKQFKIQQHGQKNKNQANFSGGNQSTQAFSGQNQKQGNLQGILKKKLLKKGLPIKDFIKQISKIEYQNGKAQINNHQNQHQHGIFSGSLPNTVNLVENNKDLQVISISNQNSININLVGPHHQIHQLIKKGQNFNSIDQQLLALKMYGVNSNTDSLIIKDNSKSTVQNNIQSSNNYSREINKNMMIYSNGSDDKIKTEMIENTISGQIISNRDLKEEEMVANEFKSFPNSMKDNNMSTDKFLTLGFKKQELKNTFLNRQAVSEERNLNKYSQSLKGHRNTINYHLQQINNQKAESSNGQNLLYTSQLMRDNLNHVNQQDLNMKLNFKKEFNRIKSQYSQQKLSEAQVLEIMIKQNKIKMFKPDLLRLLKENDTKNDQNLVSQPQELQDQHSTFHNKQKQTLEKQNIILRKTEQESIDEPKSSINISSAYVINNKDDCNTPAVVNASYYEEIQNYINNPQLKNINADTDSNQNFAIQQYTPQKEKQEQLIMNTQDGIIDMTKATYIKEQSDSKSLQQEYDLKELEFYKQKEEAYEQETIQQQQQFQNQQISQIKRLSGQYDLLNNNNDNLNNNQIQRKLYIKNYVHPSNIDDNLQNKSNLVSVSNSKNYDVDSPQLNQMMSKNFNMLSYNKEEDEQKQGQEMVDKLKKYSIEKDLELKSKRGNESGLVNKQNRVASKLQQKSVQEEYKPIQQVCVQLMQTDDYSDSKQNKTNIQSVYTNHHSKNIIKSPQAIHQNQYKQQMSFKNSQKNSRQQERSTSQNKNDSLIQISKLNISQTLDQTNRNQNIQNANIEQISGKRFQEIDQLQNNTQQTLQQVYNSQTKIQKDENQKQLKNFLENNENLSIKSFKSEEALKDLYNVLKKNFIKTDIFQMNDQKSMKQKTYLVNNRVDTLKTRKMSYNSRQKQKRLILKSPNPNDGQRIILSDQTEIEADTLLNGNIYSYGNKKKVQDESILGVNDQEYKSIARTQFIKQRNFSLAENTQKNLIKLQGRKFDTNNVEMTQTYEQVQKLGKSGCQNSTILNESLKQKMNDKNYKSRQTLKAQLENLSLQQLKIISELQNKGAIIIKDSQNQKNKIPAQQQFHLDNNYNQVSDEKTRNNYIDSDTQVDINNQQSILQALVIPKVLQLQSQEFSTDKIHYINSESKRQKFKNPSNQDQNNIKIFNQDRISNHLISQQNIQLKQYLMQKILQNEIHSLGETNQLVPNIKHDQSENIKQGYDKKREIMIRHISNQLSTQDNAIKYQELGAINNFYPKINIYDVPIKLNNSDTSEQNQSNTAYNTKNLSYFKSSIGSPFNEFVINKEKDSIIQEETFNNQNSTEHQFDDASNLQNEKYVNEEYNNMEINFASKLVDFKNQQGTKEDQLYQSNRETASKDISNREINTISNIYEKRDEKNVQNKINMQLEDDVQTDKQTEYLQQPAINKMQNNNVNSMNMSQLSSIRMNSYINQSNKEGSRRETKENIKSYFKYHAKKNVAGPNLINLNDQLFINENKTFEQQISHIIKRNKSKQKQKEISENESSDFKEEQQNINQNSEKKERIKSGQRRYESFDVQSERKQMIYQQNHQIQSFGQLENEKCNQSINNKNEEQQNQTRSSKECRNPKTIRQAINSSKWSKNNQQATQCDEKRTSMTEIIEKQQDMSQISQTSIYRDKLNQIIDQNLNLNKQNSNFQNNILQINSAQYDYMAFTESQTIQNRESKKNQYQEMNENKQNKKQLADFQKKNQQKDEELRKNEFKKILNKDLVGTISKEAYFQDDDNINNVLEIKQYAIKQNINSQKQQALKSKRASIPLNANNQSSINEKNQAYQYVKQPQENQKKNVNYVNRNQYQTQQSYTIQDLNNFYLQYGGHKNENSANFEPSSENIKQITPGTTDIDLTQNSAYGQIHQLTAQIQVRQSQQDLKNSQIVDTSSRFKEEDSKAINIMNQSYKMLAQTKNSIISTNQDNINKFQKICSRQLVQSNRPKSQGHPFGTIRLGKKTYQHSDMAQYEQFILNRKLRNISNENNQEIEDGSTIKMGDETIRFLQQAGACKEIIRYNTKAIKYSDKGIFSQISQKMKEVFSPNSKEFLNRKKSSQATKITNDDQDSQMKQRKRKSVLIEIGIDHINSKSDAFKSNSLYQQYLTPVCRLINQQRFLNNLQHKVNNKKQENIKVLFDKKQISSQNDGGSQYNFKVEDLLQLKNQLGPKPKVQLFKVNLMNNEEISNELSFNKPTIHFKAERGSVTQFQSINLEKDLEESTQTARILISKANQNTLELAQPKIRDINVYNNI